MKNIVAKLGWRIERLGKAIRSWNGGMMDPTPPVSVHPTWVEVGSGPCCGVRLCLIPNGTFEGMIAGTYDDFIYRRLDQQGYELQGKVVWDVGAHFGYHTLAFAKRVGPTGKVVAFEPNLANLKRLNLHLAANENLSSVVTVKECALGDSDGQETLRFSEDVNGGRSTCSYLDHGQPPGDRVSPKVYTSFAEGAVQVWKGDTLVKGQGCPPPAFMKIDVEGSEYLVLKGATGLIARQRPTIAMEVHNITCMFFVQALLTELGYQLELLNDGAHSASRCFVLAWPR